MAGSDRQRDLVLVLFGAALTGKTLAKRIGPEALEGSDLQRAFSELAAGQAGDVVKSWMADHGVVRENGTAWIDAVAAKMRREWGAKRMVEICTRLSFALETRQDAEASRLAGLLLKESRERGLIE